MSLIIPANTLASGGFSVDNSLRLNGTNDYMHKTGSAGSRREFTISFWMKGGSPGGGTIFSTGDYDAGDGVLQITVSTSGRLTFDDYDQDNDSYNQRWVTPGTKIFRDPAAWYHICVAVDSTQSTYANRVKFYLNGENISSLFTNNASDRPVQNADFHINYAKPHTLGRRYDAANYFPGYISEFCLIDGTTLDPTSFGEFDEDSGIFKPIDVSGLTFGNNGFYLETKQSGTSQNSSGLGADTSGNDNHFAVNNLTAVDQTTDTPTNNFCTFNPLSSTTFPTFSEGNTKTVISTSADNGAISRGNIFVSKGKWYWEVKLIGYSALSRVEIGVETADSVANNMGVAGLFGTGKARGRRGDANTIRDGNTTATYSSNLAANDIVGVALDVDNGTLIFYTNGVSQGTAFSDLTNDTWSIALGQANSTYEINTGNPPFTISSGNTDANDYGNFEYAVPSGYFSLNTKNLAEFG